MHRYLLMAGLLLAACGGDPGPTGTSSESDEFLADSTDGSILAASSWHQVTDISIRSNGKYVVTGTILSSYYGGLALFVANVDATLRRWLHSRDPGTGRPDEEGGKTKIRRN